MGWNHQLEMDGRKIAILGTNISPIPRRLERLVSFPSDRSLWRYMVMKHALFHSSLIWKDHGYQLALQESLPGPTKGTGSSQINLEPNSGLESRDFFEAKRDLEFQGRKMDPIWSLTFLVLLLYRIIFNHIIHMGRSLFKIEKKEMESQTRNMSPNLQIQERKEKSWLLFCA